MKVCGSQLCFLYENEITFVAQWTQLLFINKQLSGHSCYLIINKLLVFKINRYIYRIIYQRHHQDKPL
jgi:hypothetical protein